VSPIGATNTDGIANAQARVSYDQQVERTKPSMLKQVVDSLLRVMTIIAALTVILGVFNWAIGPIKPQSQIDIDTGKKDLADLREWTTERFAEVRGLVGQCNIRVDGVQQLIPRDAENRVSHPEAHYDEQRDRLAETKPPQTKRWVWSSD
jgi:hypothetical protein